jgi:uncharacterized membrane protein
MSTTTARLVGREPMTWVASLPLMLSTLALSLVGLGISTYLTVAHYVGTQALACSDTGVINCAKVTTSAQSVIFGIPVAVLGLCFYVAMVALTVPPAWRTTHRVVHVIRLGAVIVGMGLVLYLIGAELLIIGNICLWCSAVHVVTFLLFVLIVSQASGMFGGEEQDEEPLS